MEYVRLDGKGNATTTRARPRHNAIVTLKLDLADRANVIIFNWGCSIYSEIKEISQLQ